MRLHNHLFLMRYRFCTTAAEQIILILAETVAAKGINRHTRSKYENIAIQLRKIMKNLQTSTPPTLREGRGWGGGGAQVGTGSNAVVSSVGFRWPLCILQMAQPHPVPDGVPCTAPSNRYHPLHPFQLLCSLMGLQRLGDDGLQLIVLAVVASLPPLCIRRYHLDDRLLSVLQARLSPKFRRTLIALGWLFGSCPGTDGGRDVSTVCIIQRELHLHNPQKN